MHDVGTLRSGTCRGNWTPQVPGSVGRNEWFGRSGKVVVWVLNIVSQAIRLSVNISWRRNQQRLISVQKIFWTLSSDSIDCLKPGRSR